jgi:hypothetical protein
VTPLRSFQSPRKSSLRDHDWRVTADLRLPNEVLRGVQRCITSRMRGEAKAGHRRICRLTGCAPRSTSPGADKEKEIG